MRARLTGLIAFFLIGSAAAAQAPKSVGGSVNGAGGPIITAGTS